VKGIKKQGILERLAGVQDLDAKTTMLKPYAVAIDSKGRAFVTDTIARCVFVLDIEQKTLEYRGDKSPASFRLPMGIVIDSQDRVFVTDAENHNITVFDAAGAVVEIFGEKELERPVGLAIDPDLKRLYVADVKARRVAQYNAESFKFERWVGKSAAEKLAPEDTDKALSSPTNLVVDADGLLYVVDTFMDQIVVFDADGEFVRTFGQIGQGAGKFMRPRGITLDSDGHVYVSDAFFNVVQVLTPEGKALMPIGKTGNEPGTFKAPAGMAFDSRKRLFVVDQYNQRIEVFRYVPDAEAEKPKSATVQIKPGGKSSQ
jgi:DNA-binding beta-propeller fold protein YncE